MFPGSPDPAPAGDAITWALAHLSPSPVAVLARRPRVDLLLPRTSDVDLLAFADVPTLLPERLWPPAPLPPVDVIWLPTRHLDDPAALARWGLIAHRAADADLVHDPSGRAAEALPVFEANFHTPESAARRALGFLEMGAATVGEIGITWDFPPLALFWIQIAWSAAIAALADAHGQRAPNVYTRPLDALRALPTAVRALAEPLLPQLLLEPTDDPVPRLRRIHAAVARFPEPPWPPGYRQDTQWEYRYFQSERELQYRLGVAAEMTSRGDAPGATAYLRFWAYSLARVPMVHRRVVEGVDVAFGRPTRAIRPDLAAHCPEILGDFDEILGGAAVDAPHVQATLERLLQLKDEVTARLLRLDLPVGSPRPWRPRAPAPLPGSAPPLNPALSGGPR